MNRATHRVVALTAVFGALSLSILYFVRPSVSELELNAALAFAVFSVFGAMMPYSLSERVKGSATFVTFLASVVLVPSWITVVASSAVIMLTQMVQRTGRMKTTFNVAQHCFALSCSVAAYNATGAVGAARGGAISSVPLLIAFLAFFLANSVAVAAVVSAETRSSFLSLFRNNSLRGFGLDILAVPFIYVFVKVYLEFGVLATSAAAALVLVVRQLNSTNEELHRSNKELLELMVTTLEARDPYTSGHSRRVSEYARMMAQTLSMSAKQIERLTVAALLHDVGKVHVVFAPILSKPGQLTAEERAIMESHPIKGAELMRISSQLRDTAGPIRHHHEAWDGSGYPDALTGQKIPLFARIIAIADTIDAMASDRPYRRGLSAERIRGEMIKMCGIQFDPVILDTVMQAGTIDAILQIACASHQGKGAAEPGLALVAIG